ncbi:MAG TPA: LysR family transcriptional regulator [Kineosporiaceae bacterium]|nr:LysR family transcriptional regulator [Kineosporiaceae bacterium]
MEIQALRYVVTLAEELHFGRAAGRHFISAQPFGQRVQHLERELGVRLFERTSRRVALTAAGEQFVQRAGNANTQFDHTHPPGRRSPRAQVVPSSWQTTGPITLASDILLVSVGLAGFSVRLVRQIQADSEDQHGDDPADRGHLLRPVHLDVQAGEAGGQELDPRSARASGGEALAGPGPGPRPPVRPRPDGPSPHLPRRDLHRPRRGAAASGTT